MSAMPSMATEFVRRNEPTRCANDNISRRSKARSTHRKPGGAKGRGIGFNLCRIAATELGLEPSGDREIRAGRQKLLGSSPGFLRLAGLLIGDHDIGKAKSGASGMIRLKGRNRLFGSSRQPIGVSESAQIYCGIVWTKSHRLLAQYDRFFGISRGCKNVAGKFSCVSRPRRQFDCLSGSGNGFIVAPLKQQDQA